ncbi:hypothetical protein PHISCL_11202 [Aspergillus sclerotialis]|uniref:Uncharacterized protein n=1 Tax=Aspergillus sclerotialis TaxID=2070753 RepID=A0A3A2ZGR1_9EURO|nr:hypothetical protein PHISCL_11202 [Aspergillus sclerotialis]
MGGDDPRNIQNGRRRPPGDQIHKHKGPWQKLHRERNHDELDFLAFVDSRE